MVAATVQIPETLVTTYLEMNSPAQFRPAYIHDPQAEIVQLHRVDVSFYLFLYKEVGWDLRWRDRLIMPQEELYQALTAPTTSVYVLNYANVPAGYVELSRHGESTEVAYFGLRSSYQGMGLGKHLLSFGIEQAWEADASRVFVHTCNLDGPRAMANYLKRGFQVYHIERQPMPNRYMQ